MAKISRINGENAELAPNKYLLSGFTLQSGDGEGGYDSERYFEELELESDAVKPNTKEINPVLSMGRLLNSVKEPDKLEVKDED